MKYSFKTYYVPNTVLSSENSVNKLDILCRMRIAVNLGWGEATQMYDYQL